MTTQKLEMYKCKICGNTVQVLFSGEGSLVCCNQEMELMRPHGNENPELSEKHVPQIKREDNKIKIFLENHPMLSEHYIQLIEAYTEDKSQVYLKFLNPNETPVLEIPDTEKPVNAIELCNIHGLWRSDNA